jgi:hypothetical protein
MTVSRALAGWFLISLPGCLALAQMMRLRGEGTPHDPRQTFAPSNVDEHLPAPPDPTKAPKRVRREAGCCPLRPCLTEQGNRAGVREPATAPAAVGAFLRSNADGRESRRFGESYRRARCVRAVRRGNT